MTMQGQRPGSGLYSRVQDALYAFRHGVPARRMAGQAARGKGGGYALLWPDFRQGQPQWAMTDYTSYALEGYSTNALIFSAIMYKVRQVASVKLRAYTGEVGNPNPLDLAHPLAALCRRPNEHQSWVEFQGQATIYVNIAGNNFAVLFRPRPGALPYAMYNLRPDRVGIVPDEGFGIRGYIYRPEGKSWAEGVPLLPEDVIHTKFPNPLDPLEGMGMGLSPLTPLAQSADVDNAITHFLRLFFQYGAMQQVVLKYDLEATDEMIARAKTRWREVYGGYENWTEPMVLDQGATVERIGTTFSEMGFEMLDSRNEARILGPLGVPVSLLPTRLGAESSTYNNKELDRRAFWEDTFIPELQFFEVNYQHALADGTAWVGLDFAGVPALRRDAAALVEAAAALIDRGVPPAIAFGTVGLEVEEYEHSHVAVISTSLMLVDDLLAPPEPPPVPPVPSAGEEETPDAAGQADDEATSEEAAPDEDMPGGESGPEEEAQAVGRETHEIAPEGSDHPFTLVDIPCPECGYSPVRQYADHGGVCVCPDCGVAFDPSVEPSTEAHAVQGDMEGDRDWEAMNEAHRAAREQEDQRFAMDLWPYLDNSARIARILQISDAAWAEAEAPAGELGGIRPLVQWGGYLVPPAIADDLAHLLGEEAHAGGGDWRDAMTGLTQVQKLVHLAARMDSVAEEQLRRQLLAMRRKAYEEEVTRQAERVGCRRVRGFVGEGQLLSGLNEQCKADAAGIVNTYNRELANRIRQIAEEYPQANRHYYARRILEWDAARNAWKQDQIAQYTANSARAQAMQDFYQMNGLQGKAELWPKAAVCPVCLAWIGRGQRVTIKEATKNPPPYHVGCPHYWETYPERAGDCADLWVGEGRQ